jgi:hypothetical protein
LASWKHLSDAAIRAAITHPELMHLKDDDVIRAASASPGRQLQSVGSSVTCGLFDTYIGKCGFFTTDSECWQTSNLAGLNVCCASSADDCCKANIGVIVGVIIGALFLLGGSIWFCVVHCPCCSGCPANKHRKRMEMQQRQQAGPGQVQVQMNPAVPVTVGTVPVAVATMPVAVATMPVATASTAS